MGKLADKVCVITGGNSGIGLATAKAFKAEGAKVAIFGRNQETLDAAAAKIGKGVLPVQGDVTVLDDLEKLMTAVSETFGSIDVLFANAGIAKPTPTEDALESVVDQTLAINIKGPFYTVQKALPHLTDGGSIIITSSCVDEIAMPPMNVYASTKAAVRSLVRSLAAELAPRGIRVNSIAPGPIETPIFERTGLPAEAVDAMGEEITAKVPLGRFGKPDEIAKPVVFLASSDASYMTGAELTVDGGMAQV